MSTKKQFVAVVWGVIVLVGCQSSVSFSPIQEALIVEGLSIKRHCPVSISSEFNAGMDGRYRYAQIHTQGGGGSTAYVSRSGSGCGYFLSSNYEIEISYAAIKDFTESYWAKSGELEAYIFPSASDNEFFALAAYWKNLLNDCRLLGGDAGSIEPDCRAKAARQYSENTAVLIVELREHGRLFNLHEFVFIKDQLY